MCAVQRMIHIHTGHSIAVRRNVFICTISVPVNADLFIGQMEREQLIGTTCFIHKVL